INRELDLIRGTMKDASRWAIMADKVKNLPRNEEVGRAFSQEEKTRILEVAAQRPYWQAVRLALTLALNTTMRPCELKSLQWRDIDWISQMINLRVSKTDRGKRSIPINPDAFGALRELRDRARTVFGDDLDPQWFVFFAGGGAVKPDPTKPLGGWRKS